MGPLLDRRSQKIYLPVPLPQVKKKSALFASLSERLRFIGLYTVLHCKLDHIVNETVFKKDNGYLRAFKTNE